MLKNYVEKIFSIVLIITSIIVLSCCKNINKEINNGISFEYFYRGFTPLTDETEKEAFYSVLGINIILNEEDWYDFAQKYCPTANVLVIPDFSEEYLIIDSSMYSSRASENISINIKNIDIKNNELLITYDNENISERIYAINMNGVGHWFVNVIKVNKNYLPNNMDNIYKRK